MYHVIRQHFLKCRTLPHDMQQNDCNYRSVVVSVAFFEVEEGCSLLVSKG